MDEKTYEDIYYCKDLLEMSDAEALWLKEHPGAVIKKRRPWSANPEANGGCACKIAITYILREAKEARESGQAAPTDFAPEAPRE